MKLSANESLVMKELDQSHWISLNTLISGGESDSGALSQILVFHSAQSTWLGGGQPMKYPRYDHAVGLLPNVSRFCP